MVSSVSQNESSLTSSGDLQISDDEQLNNIPFDTDECLRRFSQKYEVQNVLGTGISGVVRKCIEKASGNKFAVKIVDLIGQKENDRDSLQESTLREISILRMLNNHPYIIELHDAFVGKTHILLVLELCQKELFDILMEVVTFSETRTRVVMKQLLTAVEFIHSKKIAHRDIKAENILVDANNNIKLSDFGFASTLEHDNEFTDLCGTFDYLSPELLKNQLYDNHQGYGRSVDMWACGTLMYTLLQGYSPFWAPERAQILKNILGAKFSFNNPKWNDSSSTSKDLIARLLEVDPNDRLTATEALRHPFFRTEDYTSLVIENDTNISLSFFPSTTPPKTFMKLPQFLPAPPQPMTTTTTTPPTTTMTTTTTTMTTPTATTTPPTSPLRMTNIQASCTMLSSSSPSTSTSLTLTKKNPLRVKLKAAILAVQATIFFLRLIPRAIIPVYQVSTDPYSVRSFRRLIDHGAFKIYGHWVNRDPTQSRDLLFENQRRKDSRVITRQRLIKSNLLKSSKELQSNFEISN